MEGVVAGEGLKTVSFLFIAICCKWSATCSYWEADDRHREPWNLWLWYKEWS